MIRGPPSEEKRHSTEPTAIIMSKSRSEIPTISAPKSFKVEIKEDAIEDLKRRLQNARYADDSLLPEEKSFSMELHPKLPTLKEWAKEWESLDFKSFEKELNQYEHFMSKIDWCDLHFVHRKSSRSDAVPLILLHGFPGTFYEFHHMIDTLADPSDPDLPAFHVVAPSLPGFCWSSAPRDESQTGVDSYSRVLNALMFGLGYERYSISAGDWGSAHARCLGAKFQFQDGTGCKAVHLNFCPCGPAEGILTKFASLLPTSVVTYLASWTLSEDQQKAIVKALRFGDKNTAYYKIQQTRPAQLAPGLIDSPIGLLSWVGHFFTPSLNQSPTLTLEAALKDISLYWFTGCIGTSFLPYTYNMYMPDIVKDPSYYIKVPFAYSGFPREISDGPSKWVSNTGNLIWYAKAKEGGHFAAMEKPQIFCEHLRNCFAENGKNKAFNFDNGILKDGLMIKGGLWDEERKLERRKSRL